MCTQSYNIVLKKIIYLPTVTVDHNNIVNCFILWLKLEKKPLEKYD